MRDNTNPTGAWEFNGEVAACFANMLERSIPDYRSMRALAYNAGERFVKPGTLIVDVGCSSGLAVEPFVTKHRDENDFLLIDNAPAMVQSCRAWISSGRSGIVGSSRSIPGRWSGSSGTSPPRRSGGPSARPKRFSGA